MPDEHGDLLPLPVDDFRRVRSYLAPWAFATWEKGDGDTWPPPSEPISEEDWDGIMVLPTDVLLKTTSYEGSWTRRLRPLASGWDSEVFDLLGPAHRLPPLSSVTRSIGQLQTPFIRYSQRHRRPHPCPHRRTAAHRDRITPTQKRKRGVCDVCSRVEVGWPGLGAGLGQVEVVMVPVAWKMTRRPISTAWSAKRS